MKGKWAGRLWRGIGLSVLGSVVLGGCVAGVPMAGPAGAVAPPALKITPGPYHNEQLINLSVGPNHFFKPYSRINIIECADPGGQAKNLPISVDGCDGNTIQGVTVLVQPDGSWYEHGYQLYALPNASSAGGEHGLGARVQPEKELCSLHRAEPGEVYCPQDLLRPIRDLEVGQAFVNRCWNVLRLRSIWLVVGVCLVASAAVGTFVQAAEASGTPPAVSLSPSGNFSNGQTISVTAGANGYFTPHAGVNILECADPGGSPANLPTDISACDGNTIQGTTVLVANDGSFSEISYQVYSLPNSVLGEQTNDKPICNQTNYCVLYVGQNQNDFTAPKTFSAPFLISQTSDDHRHDGRGRELDRPLRGSRAAPPASRTRPQYPRHRPPREQRHGSSTSGTARSSLADTGPSSELMWLAGTGAVLLLGGVVGRRRCTSEGGAMSAVAPDLRPQQMTPDDDVPINLSRKTQGADRVFNGVLAGSSGLVLAPAGCDCRVPVLLRILRPPPRWIRPRHRADLAPGRP